jgi:hypothetical protein
LRLCVFAGNAFSRKQSHRFGNNSRKGAKARRYPDK